MAPNGEVTLGEVYRRLERMDEREEMRFRTVEATLRCHGEAIAVLVSNHENQMRAAHDAGRSAGAKWGTGAGAAIGAAIATAWSLLTGR